MNTVRRWSKIFTFNLIFMVLGLMALEGLSRYFQWLPEVGNAHLGRFQISENPILAYEPIPHKEYLFQDLSRDEPIEFAGRSNQLGLRDRDIPPANSQRRRVFLLGDSVVQGVLEPNTNNVFSHILQRKLEATGKPVDVFNLGIAGYNTLQEVEFLRNKALGYKPTDVWLFLVYNDFEGISPIRYYLEQHQSEHLQLPQMRLMTLLFFWKRYNRNFPNVADSPESVIHGLNQLEVMAKSSQFKLRYFIVGVSTSHQKYDHAKKERDRLVGIVKSRAIDSFDFQRDTGVCHWGSNHLFHSDGTHLSALGHECVASQLLTYLQ